MTNTSNNNCTHWPQSVSQIDNMRQEISNRDIYIIALQTNLMSAREQIEVLRKKNDSLSAKNDECQKMIDEVAILYILFLNSCLYLRQTCCKLIVNDCYPQACCKSVRILTSCKNFVYLGVMNSDEHDISGVTLRFLWCYSPRLS